MCIRDSSSAELSWDYDSDMDFYNVRYRERGTSNWNYERSIESGSVEISNLSSDVGYQWQVRAVCPDGSATTYLSGRGPDFRTDGGGNNNNVVVMRKRNATGYALDGNRGAANNQNIHLWSYDPDNRNQQWIEIDRGGGFYSYQKMDTNHCIDGGGGGANRQNLKLWTCSSNNQNQHWKKISVGGGAYRLEKRNANDYSIDGNGGGANRQNVYLWSNGNNNQNQQWVFEVVGSAKLEQDQEVELLIYPNPFSNNLTVELPTDIDSDIMMIQLMDITGKIVYQQAQLSTGQIIQISKDLPNGVYTLKWVDEKNQLFHTQKIIKQ